MSEKSFDSEKEVLNMPLSGSQPENTEVKAKQNNKKTKIIVMFDEWLPGKWTEEETRAYNNAKRSQYPDLFKPAKAENDKFSEERILVEPKMANFLSDLLEAAAQSAIKDRKEAAKNIN